MGKEEATAATTLLKETIEKAGGCGVIDGGLATQLEIHGASFDDPLWSAVCLINDPHLIKRVHLEYLEAGADVLVTSSYQATIPGFLSRGLSMQEAESLLEKSVRLAIDARDEFWNAVNKKSENSYNRALVAASVGSYGAYLADGSEYSGHYGQNIDVAKLKDFHRRRVQVLAGARPDILAFETIPNRLETQAIIELLEEENINIPSWICYSSVDGEHASSGESFEECLSVINKSKKVAIVGINCAPPQYVDGLIRKFKKLTDKLIAVYPNSGETWDGKAKKWLPPKCSKDNDFGSLAIRWRDSGAKLIGGCCRTSPATVRDISKAMKTNLDL
ncbi:homocysteine S-methyltransferase 1-like [Chenopodium quinoa]|uniref:homocysteine S-methyltransferase 1-like n=1 Tax=Chenopodium quinoa TaxID=63459 RepID=UPI000B770B42|nr:homocysteine S-methyltransferase 1-like [Chenopodium quinoa]XP_021753824.1 homocysteine S-methyltransferase 1-like [Chenopodium quinoa]